MIVLCDRVASERSGKLQRNEMEGNVARAAWNRDWEKVRRLVEQGGNVNDVDHTFYRSTALHFAAMYGNSDICSLLLSRGANVSQTDENGNTPLHDAAYHHYVDICQLLVDHKADVTSVNTRGKTPLHTAFSLYRSNTPAVCRPLITNESVNVADRLGNRTLHIAARNGNIQTVQLLVDCGADVNALNGDGQTPLHTAVGGEKDCPELCSILLKHDAKIDVVDKDGNQPLHLACKRRHAATGNLLLSNGADVTALNKQQQRPLHLANESILNSFQVHSGDHALHIVARNGDIQTVQLLVDCGADVNALNEDGQTPLHTAAGGEKDCPELCSILLKHNEIDAVDKDGNQPLHLACDAALTSTVQHLLDCNADVLATNNFYQTALHKAACSKRDCPEVCVMLIAKGAQVNATDGNGDTSKHVACQKGKMNTVDVLVENDGDCNVLNVCGETLLHLACKSRVECVELCDKLISHGVNPHIADREGNLPLHVALKNRLAKTFGWLFEHLGRPSLDDLEKVNISKEDLVANLDYANEAGDTRTCHYILELIAKLDTSNELSLSALNCRSRSGYLLLHTAIQKQDFTLCQYLIDHGASVNAEVVPYKHHGRRYSEHPLHLAVKLGCIDLCRLLIEHGALVDAEMKGGRTALHLAIVNEKKDIARLLLSHGANLSKVKISGESAVMRSEKRGNLKMASIIQASGEREKRNILLTFLTLLKFVLFIETFPEEIVSQGETALHIYLSSCDEGSAVNVFLRVDVVGRDGAGKTSLTKSLTLQKFNRDEPSTRGVVFDPKCQIIVKEACDWTNPLTSADYTEIYEKNVVINMADTLDTPQVKDQYFKSKEGQPPKRQKRSRVASKSSKQDSNMQAVSVPSTDDIEVAKSQKSQVDFVQQSPIPSPIMNAIESLTQDSDLQSFPVMSEYDIESLLYDGVDPMWSVAIATNETSDDFSSLLSETQQKISAISESPQSAASDIQQSLQTPLNLSTCKDSNVFPPNTATEWQSPSGTNIQVVSACSTSHEQLEKDSMDVDKSVEDERDSNSIVTNFGSRLPSSQQEQEQQPKKQRLKKRKRKAIESASSFQEIEFEGIKMSDGSKCQNVSQPEIKKKTMQSVIRNTDVLSSDNQDMQQQQRQQQQQQQQEGTKVNRNKQTKASSSQYEETLSLNVDESSTENTTTLPQHIQERVSKSLRDPSSRQKAKKEIMLTVLDYAGQNVFYVTHHLIMSKAAFMYIVFNASLPMDDKTPCQFRSEDGTIIHIPLFDNETNFDRLEEWVSGVHIMEGDQSRRITIFEEEGIRSPAMFLVGTHVDELKEQPGMMEKQDAFIRKKLEGTVLAEHIIWASKDVMCFYVDNTVTDPDSGVVDPQVKLLRQKTEEVAHAVAQHHRLPIRWLKYEQKVREVKVSYPLKKTTTVDELLQLAMNAAGIKSREELLVLLQYLSSRAVLMYHPEALKSGDDEEVVLDVEWFVSQLQKVITIYMEGDVPPMLWNDVKRSKEKGIMTMSLVRHLLSDAGSAQHLIVSLMRHYDLLCEYSVIEEENIGKANCQDFLNFEVESKGPLHSEEEQNMFERDACFIPCLLEHAVGLESDKMNDELKSLPLVLSSAPIRIPQPLFYRVLTLLCKRFRRLAVIYRNVGYFHIYPGHRLEFALNRYNFQMTVLSHTALNAKVCVAIREWIVDAVNKAKQQGMAGLKLHLGFMYEASTSESQSCTVEFISLDGYQHTRFELYSSVTKDEIQPPDRLSLWYPQLEFSVSNFCIIYLSLSELLFTFRTLK